MCSITFVKWDIALKKTEEKEMPDEGGKKKLSTFWPYDRIMHINVVLSFDQLSKILIINK